MEKENTNIKNAICSFVCPLRLENKTIYGFIYNKDAEKELSDFVSYLRAAQDFSCNGGRLGIDTWSYGEYNISVGGFKNLIGTLYSNKTRYILHYYDEPLIYTSEEVDDDCFITNTSLFERYISHIYQKKKVCYEEDGM